jgi:hypothetical protein
MSGGRSATIRCRGLRFAAAAVALLLFGSTGCSYLKRRRKKSEERSELPRRPGNLTLEEDYAPQDCYGLAGCVAVPVVAKGVQINPRYGR